MYEQLLEYLKSILKLCEEFDKTNEFLNALKEITKKSNNNQIFVQLEELVNKKIN